MNQAGRPEFLYFDLGKVLIDFDHEQAVQQLANLSGCSSDHVRQQVFQAACSQEYERGGLSTSAFCERVRSSLNCDLDDQAICLSISRIFSTNRPMLPLVSALWSSGIRMGILSNTCDAHWRFLHNAGYGFLDLFPVHALSFRLGCLKPEPEIYHRAADLAGVSPHRIFFTDDIPANVQAACQAGFDAVPFTGVMNLASELRQRDIPFNF